MFDSETIDEVREKLDMDDPVGNAALAATFLLLSTRVMEKYPDADDCPAELREFLLDVAGTALVVSLSQTS